MGVERKKITPVMEHDHGVCVWEMPDGRLLADSDLNYLSMEGKAGDIFVELKMEKAAKYWLGSEFDGKARWIFGARKVTDNEHDDMMERLLDGKIPDWRETGDER